MNQVLNHLLHVVDSMFHDGPVVWPHALDRKIVCCLKQHKEVSQTGDADTQSRNISVSTVAVMMSQISHFFRTQVRSAVVFRIFDSFTELSVQEERISKNCTLYCACLNS